MPKTSRLFKSFLRLLLPAVFLCVAALISGSVWLVYTSARPYRAPYLVTPEKFGQLSSRAAQVTEETWTNRDGSSSRGWLLRGTDGSPAVILYHKYGADRSYVLNLGVKLNESTNFTVLMPDLRGHGEKPIVDNASFGGCEAEDAGAAIEFLRGLQTPNEITLVGKNIGIYGVEMGASVALTAASRDQGIKALALDSVPLSPRTPTASFARRSSADIRSQVPQRRVWLNLARGSISLTVVINASRHATRPGR
jgi:pimeloyl-ACP methyl ester carboxylesterase